MLESLHIENIAVISKADVNFSNGFNVLTGETGAGKSILIDSINLILGGRASRDIIRSGQDSAFVSAVFSNLDNKINSIFEKFGITIDDSIIFSRTISIDGKSVCRINDRPVSSSTMRECAACLVDIHGQHDSGLLMIPEKHIEYIDAISNNYDYLLDYQNKYNEYNQVANKIEEIKNSLHDKERKLDLLLYQRDEIVSANIKVGEESELCERKKVISNKQKIISAINDVRERLRDHDQYNAVDCIYYSKQDMESISNTSSVAGEIADSLSDLYYNIQDLLDKVDDLYSNVDNTDNIDDIEDRLSVIYNLKRKYGSDEEQILNYLQKIENEISTINCSDDLLKELEKDKLIKYDLMVAAAAVLSKKRKEAALHFSNKVIEQMLFLDMPYVKFCAEIVPCEYYSSGAETCEFTISVNPGEPLKSIAKVASGGELSRIMLAIKTALAENDDIPTIIFDEIDSGISGRAADKVALKMKEVSKRRQVFSVTHLAQIAAYADNHLLVEKNVYNDNTYTTISKLDYDGRINEIARIIGGSTITDITKNSACEMLTLAQKENNNANI